MNSKIYAERCLRDEAQSLLDLIPQLDKNFEQVVDLIHHCTGHVVVTGVGKSGHVGAKSAATLASTGTPAIYLNALDALHGDLGMIMNNDILFMISNSGNTDELLRIIASLEDRHIPIVSMTGESDSLLAQHSTYHILCSVEREACPLNLAPTSSTTAAMAMGDALACALMVARNFKATDFAQYHPGGTLGKRLLTRAKDVMRTEDLPVISPETKLGEAVIHVSNGRLGLCVATVNDQVAGIITDGDIRRAMESSQDKFFQLKMEDIMTRTPKMVSPETKVTEIEDIMHRNKIHCVLVVDGEKHLLGVVDSFRTMI